MAAGFAFFFLIDCVFMFPTVRFYLPRSVSIANGRLVVCTPYLECECDLAVCRWFPGRLQRAMEWFFVRDRDAAIIEFKYRGVWMRHAVGLDARSYKVWTQFLEVAAVPRHVPIGVISEGIRPMLWGVASTLLLMIAGGVNGVFGCVLFSVVALSSIYWAAVNGMKHIEQRSVIGAGMFGCAYGAMVLRSFADGAIVGAIVVTGGYVLVRLGRWRHAKGKLLSENLR